MSFVTRQMHRDSYRPTREPHKPRHESYLRPRQMAKSIYFHHIAQFERPTIQAVHERRHAKMSPRQRRIRSMPIQDSAKATRRAPAA